MESATIIDAALFDLDGTLVHTAPCIAAALNQSLKDNGLATLEPSAGGDDDRRRCGYAHPARTDQARHCAAA